MGRFRSAVRRVAKPVAMMFVAGLLAISLTVTTTQKAEANPLLLPPLLLASGTMPVGTALGLVSLTGPIGWGLIGLGALAVGLAVTQDYWLPYVNGDFGKPKGDDEGTVTNGFVRARDGLVAQPPTPTMTGLSGLQLNVTYATPPRTGSWTLDVAIMCKRPDGTEYAKSMQGNFSYEATTSARFDCNAAGDVVMEGQMGAPCSLTVSYTTTACTQLSPYYGPTNVVSWGVHSKAFDPKGSDVRYQTTVECVKPDGTFFTLSAESTGDQGAIKMPSCAAAVPGSHGTGKTLVEGYPPGKTVPETLWDNPRIPASTEYPLCAPDRPGPMCSLAVTVDGKPCVDAVGTFNCANWRDIANQDITRVQCSYGPYLGLAVDVCNPMERAYESPDGTLATEPNLDGNPATRNDSSPAGEPYQKPSNSTATVPGAGGSPAPGPAGSPEAQIAECWPNGWAALNPAEWILKPMNCAFVPKADLQARVQNTVNTASALPPMSWFAGVNMTAPGGASCPDWTVHVGGFSENVICGSSFTDALRGSRNLVFTMLAGAMVWPLIRSLWYASIPFIRVSPGSSK